MGLSGSLMPRWITASPCCEAIKVVLEEPKGTPRCRETNDLCGTVLILSLSVQLNRTHSEVFGKSVCLRRWEGTHVAVGAGESERGNLAWGVGKLVVGVRFTLVRLAPVDIPGIPTSGMLEAPPSSSSNVGGCGGLVGLSCCCAHTDWPLWSLVEQKPHTPP